PTPPALLNPKLSPALAMVILQAIAKDSTDRFPSASAMAMALCQALDMPTPETLRQVVQSSEGIDLFTELSPRESSQSMKAVSARGLRPQQGSLADERQRTLSLAGLPETSPIVSLPGNTMGLSSSSLPVQQPSSERQTINPSLIEAKRSDGRDVRETG